MLSPTYVASATFTGDAPGKLEFKANADALAATLTPFFKGDKGDPGGALTHATAGETLSGHVVVAYDADGLIYKASQNNDSALRVAGFTTGAVVHGEQATVQRSDVLGWPANNLVQGLVFLGVGGEVTQIQPSTGYVVVVGAAISTNKIRVELGAIFQS